MQVNNNVQSPTFGMALKIKKTPNIKKALETLPRETIDNLQKVGEQLKDTKFYHIKVDDDLSVKLVSDKDAYWGLFETRDYKTSYATKTISDKPVAAENVILLENPNEGCIAGIAKYGKENPNYKVCTARGTLNKINNIRPLANIAKILDDAAVEKYTKLNKNELETLRKAEKTQAIDRLLNTFGE